MKKFILLSVLILNGIICISAQQAAPQPTPSPQASPNAVETDRIIRQRQESDRRFEALRDAGKITGNTNLSRMVAFQSIGNIYRKPTKEEFKLLAPSKEDLKKNAQFLRQADTGLVRLIADRGCADSTRVVNVSDNCLRYTMPGAGSSYSFRAQNYRIRRLADLTYADDGFQSPGILAHAILVNIGNVPLEQVSLQTKGLRFLIDFETVAEYERAREIDRQITEGVENDGFTYSRSAEASENTTYVLRSIAYRGAYYRALQGFTYDELGFDKRKDIIVAFQIVSRDNESVTILWKQLSVKDSPKIKRKNNGDSDIKENNFLAESDN